MITGSSRPQYYPNASDTRLVTDLQYKIPGDDSEFIVDRFEDFLKQQMADKNPFLAHLCKLAQSQFYY